MQTCSKRNPEWEPTAEDEIMRKPPRLHGGAQKTQEALWYETEENSADMSELMFQKMSSEMDSNILDQYEMNNFYFWEHKSSFFLCCLLVWTLTT